MRVLVLAILAAAACGSDDDFECVAPRETTYSREPIVDGTPGCAGGPVWTSVHDNHAMHADDPDQVFSVGTRATVPECACCYPSGRTFECGVSNGVYGWDELL
jgi:hypothetical protein